MNKIKKKKIQKAILGILIITVIGIAYYTYITHTNEKIVRATKELQIKQKLVTELKSISEKKLEIEEEIKNLKKEEVILEQKIPSYDFSNQITAELYKLSTNGSIKADKINVSSVKEKGNYSIIGVSFDTSGNMKDIKKAINYFKNYKQKLCIKTFRLQAKPDNIYSASMNIELYFQTE